VGVDRDRTLRMLKCMSAVGHQDDKVDVSLCQSANEVWERERGLNAFRKPIPA